MGHWIGDPVRLLISIAAISEVEAALTGGAQILDVKNPARGSLGPADPRVVRAARGIAPLNVPVSAALGDRLPDSPSCPHRLADLAFRLQSSGAAILKVGLAGIRMGHAVAALAELRERLDARREGHRPLSRTAPVRHEGPGVQLVAPAVRHEGPGVRLVAPGVRLVAPAVRLVAVAFADVAGENGVRPDQVVEVAVRAGVAGAMLDTLRKGRSIFQVLGESTLGRWVEEVRAGELLCGLAGSLTVEDAVRASSLGADVVGLRGAVCAGGRSGRVVAERVRGVRDALESVAAASVRWS